MIVCTECGHRNADNDDFCGNCGAFLEFSGEAVDTPAHVTAETATPEPEAAETESTAAAEAEEAERTARAAQEAAEREEAARAAQEAAEAEEAARAAEEKQRAAEEASRAAEEAKEAAEAERRLAAAADEQLQVERATREEAERAAAEARAEAEQATLRAARAEEQTESLVAQEAERARAEAQERAAEQTAEALARAETERSAREEADRARTEAETRAQDAEAARVEAERRAEEAERAARMAALVAQPKPARPEPARRQPRQPKATAPVDDVSASGEAASAPGKSEADDATVGGRQPAARRPERQRVRRPRADTGADDIDVVNPGDLICGECGAGNEPSRKYCRRCGQALAEATVAPTPPWYRRILSRRQVPKAAAGTRPAARGRRPGLRAGGAQARRRISSGVRRVALLGSVLVLAGVILALTVGPWQGTASDAWDRVRQRIAPQFEPVRPSGVTATSELPGRPALFAIDQVRNTYWAEGSEGDGAGEGLTFTFAAPVDIDKVGFLNGASESPGDFVTQPRLREVQLLFDDGTTRVLELADTAEFQSFDVRARGVQTVQLQILSVHPSLQGSAASLAEVEFFTGR